MSLEVPQRVSPRAARQLKTVVSEPNSVPSSSQVSRTPKERSPKVIERRSPSPKVIECRSPSPKVIERRSPRSPASSEKKRPHRISELEFQILQLHGNLKKATDELSFYEAWKKQAKQDAEESGKQILELSSKLEETQRQILRLSSEESHTCEFKSFSQEMEQAWQAELKDVKKQHLLDSSALTSAVNEILRLKNELEMVANSEVAQKEQAESIRRELENLTRNMAETECLVENMKAELKDSRESESQARALVNNTLTQLESAKATVEALLVDRIKGTDSYKMIASELDQSRALANELQGLVSKLEANQNNYDKVITSVPSEVDCTENKSRVQNTHEKDRHKKEIEFLKFEVERLSVLNDTEAKKKDSDKDRVGQLKDASELKEKITLEWAQREAELVAGIDKAKATIEDLKARLMDKETELQGIVEENEGLNSKLEESLPMLQKESSTDGIEKLKEEMLELKVTVMDKETALQRISEENESMKSDIKKRDDIIVELEVARNAEKEALVKLNLVMEEVEKSNRRAGRVTEQLEASQASASEMESELRRLKVQSDQWRKAAEAAATMISVGGNGKYMDRTASLDSGYLNGRMGSPYADDVDDDLTKKKNGHVLKKFGVLWKKQQK